MSAELPNTGKSCKAGLTIAGVRGVGWGGDGAKDSGASSEASLEHLVLLQTIQLRDAIGEKTTSIPARNAPQWREHAMRLAGTTRIITEGNSPTVLTDSCDPLTLLAVILCQGVTSG